MTWKHLGASAIPTQLLFSRLTMKVLPASFCFLSLRSSTGEKILLPIPGGYFHKILMQKDNGIKLYAWQRTICQKKKQPTQTLWKLPTHLLPTWKGWLEVKFVFVFVLFFPQCCLSAIFQILFCFGPFSTTLSTLFGLQHIEGEVWRWINSGFKENFRLGEIKGRGNWAQDHEVRWD